jgi:hypothetical protein
MLKRIKKLFCKEESLIEPPANLMLSEEEIRAFTKDGLSAFKYNYMDHSTPEVQALMNKTFTKNTFKKYQEMVRRRESNYYGQTDNYIYEALKEFSIQKKDLCIFGSATPWYEALALEFGVEKCYVIEYSERKSFDDRVVYIKPEDQYSRNYDVAFSVSSFEHDGLGRYGDPVSADGDLVAMKNAKKVVSKNGLLFLSLPVGKDTIYFNSHRIYGRNRLPLMFEGWELVKAFGYKEKDLKNTRNSGSSTPYQPLFILRNT